VLKSFGFKTLTHAPCLYLGIYCNEIGCLCQVDGFSIACKHRLVTQSCTNALWIGPPIDCRMTLVNLCCRTVFMVFWVRTIFNLFGAREAMYK